MTAEQAFNVSMNEYPSLYTSYSLERAKMKFYDHIFNIIGNGFGDMEEFKEEHTINKFNKHLIDSFPDKYISNTPLYMAYKEHARINSFIDETLERLDSYLNQKNTNPKKIGMKK